jgi:2-dehydropantoate 2-reductase
LLKTEQEGALIVRIAVMGAGSIGLLLAAKLTAVTERIEVITRTEAQAEQIRKNGISIEGESTTPGNKFKVFSYENTATNPRVDTAPQFLLLAVKQSAISEELVDFIMQRISPHTTVVCYQNGIGHEDKLLNHLEKGRLLLAVTTEGARKLGPAQVAHTGRGVTDLGFTYRIVAETYPASQKKVAEMLGKAGFAVSLSKNMNTKIWSKLIINSIINPLTAILQVRNGELLRSSASLALMSALYKEGIAVAQGEKVELPDNLWETVLKVCESTADNQSSMLQDIVHHRITELESINGSLLRIAKKMELELPVNQTIYQMVRALENK